MVRQARHNTVMVGHREKEGGRGGGASFHSSLGRDLARPRLSVFWTGSFLKNLLFGKNFYEELSYFDFLGIRTKYSPNKPSSRTWLRPLQFNYLSYELFLEKKSCQTPKKKKKKVIFGVLRTKVVLKFSVRLQKKKKKCKF